MRAASCPGDFQGRSRCHDPPALVPRARADVDHPVASGDHAHVVLDDDDRVARIDEPVQLRHEPLDVRRMQAGRRLVEDVERVAALRALQLGGELDALRFAAGELRRGLAEPQVSEADLAQHVERSRNVRLVGEELPRRIDRHAAARRRCSCRDM